MIVEVQVIVNNGKIGMIGFDEVFQCSCPLVFARFQVRDVD